MEPPQIDPSNNTLLNSYNDRTPRIFDRYFSSSDDESYPSGSFIDNSTIETTSKRLDYMIQFLDRKLASTSTTHTADFEDEPTRSSLPEFIGRGGGVGMFKVPLRAAVHPGRPPSLELRSHPLRETQIRCFFRTIVGSEGQLWAGCDNGIRVWSNKDLYAAGHGIDGLARKGDEDTAPFTESAATSATLCLVVDEGSRLIWSGHRDGKIRSWKMDFSVDGANRFKEYLSWQAHRAPVLSMVMTSYGDLWSGSEGGIIKIWPWEKIEKSISLTVEERHMAALLVERSYIDLRSQATANGFGNVLSSDVKYLLSDNSRAKVWSAGYLSFALWDAHTRELLKVFNVDGQIENRGDMTAMQDLSAGFFQRSRNAILGAADAVRRATAKGDENRRTEALVITVDGTIWSGCSNGLLVQWDGNGNRIQEFQYHSSAVQCFCTFGLHIWVGYVSGTVQVLDLQGNLLGGWVAHNSPVIRMAVWMGYIFTLANHGGVRGWNITSPGPVDSILCSELASKEYLYTTVDNLKILSGTWNVAQEKASHDSIISWIGSAASDAGVVVVGLQEVEMGAGFLAISAARETVGLEGSAVGQWWLDMIGKTLDEGSMFERVGSRQLAGLLIAVWVRNNLRSHVGDLDVAAVPCGFGRAIGNKGAVGLRIRVYNRVMCFVNCHFAAHLEAVSRRNDDFDHVYRTMAFARPSNPANAATAGASSSLQIVRGTNVGTNPSDVMPELSEADMVIFLGDFNYRLDDISYDEARDFISQRCFDWLRERDQLRAEMEVGNVFQGMREADIRFPPTYKFEKHQVGLAGYDSGEKKRIPAWCDRILYRDSRLASESECSLECPVVSSILQYEACMDVTDSDHKPVRCIFNVDIARVDESIRRQEFGEIMRLNENVKYTLEKLCKIPETIVSTNNIILQNEDTSILRITNKCGKNEAFFEIICESECTIKEDGQASDHCTRGSFGFPRWLEVSPAAGIIKPDQIAEVSVHHEEFKTLEEFVDGIPQNWWCEDARDKEVIMVIKMRGSCTAETRNHRVRVRHCFSAKTRQTKPKNSPQVHSNILQRSNFQHLSSSYDVVNHLGSLHSP